MSRPLTLATFAPLAALLAALSPAALLAQAWELLPADASRKGPVASVCPLGDDETGNYFCLTLGCGDGGALHYEMFYAGGAALEGDAVAVSIDGRDAGVLSFERLVDADEVGADEVGEADADKADADAGEVDADKVDADGAGAGEAGAGDGFRYRADYDPDGHGELIARLRGGNRAALSLPFGDETVERVLGLRGSSRAIGAVLEACPEPVIPLTDPAGRVLAEITRECKDLGGTVDVEPGFLRRDDLDGDGRDDIVVEYVAAVCSEMASLYCGSGGCTVGFFLNRGEEYLGLYSGVIRGYDVEPGGILSLDLHGSACGLFGYQACRKRFDVSGDELVLVEELTEEAAIAALEAAEAGAGGVAEDAAAETAGTPGAEATALAAEDAGDVAVASDVGPGDTGPEDMVPGDVGPGDVGDVAGLADVAPADDMVDTALADDVAVPDADTPGVEVDAATDEIPAAPGGEAGVTGPAEDTTEKPVTGDVADADGVDVDPAVNAPDVEANAGPEAAPDADTAPEPESEVAPDADTALDAAPDVAQGFAPDAAADAAPDGPDAPADDSGPRLEWIGDGGAATVFAPLEGETLPDDLGAPAAPEVPVAPPRGAAGSDKGKSPDGR